MTSSSSPNLKMYATKTSACVLLVLARPEEIRKQACFPPGIISSTQVT